MEQANPSQCDQKFDNLLEQALEFLPFSAESFKFIDILASEEAEAQSLYPQPLSAQAQPANENAHGKNRISHKNVPPNKVNYQNLLHSSNEQKTIQQQMEYSRKSGAINPKPKSKKAFPEKTCLPTVVGDDHGKAPQEGKLLPKEKKIDR